jgi:hypothetical protein
MAEANCWTAEACPSGTCSKTEEQCYGISTERCLSPAPTDAPTVAEPTTTDSMVSSLPTPASASPTTSSVPTVEVVNTQFCGLDYDDAMSSCSEATACPSGSGCPSNMGCYTGISCTATLTLLTTNAPATGSHVSSLSTPASTSPTTSSASTVVNTQFCGMDYDDAMASCSEATACPTGDGCLNGMSCYTGISCSAFLPPSSAPPTVLMTVAGSFNTTMSLASPVSSTPMTSPPTALLTAAGTLQPSPLNITQVAMSAGIVMDSEAQFAKPEQGWEWALKDEISGSSTSTVYLAMLFGLVGATLLVLF